MVADEVRGAGRQAEVGHWHDALDHVESVARAVGLTGWSFGVPAEREVHTYTRGFSDLTRAAYACLSVDADLPGPVTLVTGRDQYFHSRDDALRRYPLTAGIIAGTEHDAAAVLALGLPRRHRNASTTGATPLTGFLALHFGTARTFEAQERARLERLAAAISASLPVPRTVGLPRPGTPPVAEAMTDRIAAQERRAALVRARFDWTP